MVTTLKPRTSLRKLSTATRWQGSGREHTVEMLWEQYCTNISMALHPLASTAMALCPLASIGTTLHPLTNTTTALCPLTSTPWTAETRQCSLRVPLNSVRVWAQHHQPPPPREILLCYRPWISKHPSPNPAHGPLWEINLEVSKMHFLILTYQKNAVHVYDGGGLRQFTLINNAFFPYCARVKG